MVVEVSKKRNLYDFLCHGMLAIASDICLVNCWHGGFVPAVRFGPSGWAVGRAFT
jgi:hypothetical protein